MRSVLTRTVLVFVAAAACHRPGIKWPEPNPIVNGRDLRANPPAVEKLNVQFLKKPTDQGNALATVRFARGVELPRQIVVETEAGTRLLRDDGQGGDAQAGDGVFSAIIPVDSQALAARNERLAQIEKATGKPPVRLVFDGRVLKERIRVPRFEPEKFGRAPFDAADFVSLITAAEVKIDRSLMITDLSVVEDPARTFDVCKPPGSQGTKMGKWTFAHLVTEMANQSQTGLDPVAFTRRWLRAWETAQSVNGFPVAARTNISTVIQKWQQDSGGPGAPLDLAVAPFRLLAIVNRVDLADNLVYGGSGSAGEARFVFGVLDPNCATLPFAVIFEYGVTANGCAGLKAWAQKWFDLGALTFGASYNQALEAITETFVKAGAAPAKPNGSALNQLRTNEIALGAPWELREFRLDPLEGGNLRQVTVKQTPDLGINRTQRLVDYVNNNEALVVADEHVVPLDFPLGSPFLGGNAPTDSQTFWNNPVPPPPTITNREARFHFSLNTCNGCHNPETRTPFTHVGPRAIGTPAALSCFLTGIGCDVTDPADDSPTRHFADLDRRAQRLADLVGRECFFLVPLTKMRMVH
jgi:hypothetical protein